MTPVTDVREMVERLKWLGAQSANWVNIDQAWARKLAREAADMLESLSSQASKAREEAIEEAALALEAIADEWDRKDDPDYAGAFRQAANAVRALPSPAGDSRASLQPLDASSNRPEAKQ